ncbi:MAG: class III extradiol ring-cleavage dioxygenase [Polyangiales bacterium]
MTTTRMPALFVAHGAPTLALDPRKGEPLRAWGAALPRPKAILVISAHWDSAPITVETSVRPRLVYDFYGFPEPLYRLRYDAPGAPELAERVASMLSSRGPVARAERGWDHGLWVPFLHLFPEADLPILQISMPAAEGERSLYELGRALAPLRDEGVLIVGSGNLVHNLRMVDFSDRGPPPAFALEFDAWAKEAIERRDVDALVDFRQRAPAARLAHPTPDHYQPLLVVLGAADGGRSTRYAVEGFEYGNIDRRSIELS